MGKKVSLYNDIDKFVTNALSEEKEEKFLSQISDEKDLRDKTLLTTLMIKGVRDNGRTADEVLIEEIMQYRHSN